MTEERARRVHEVFGRAVEIEGKERADFLDRTCGDRTRDEVEALLEAHAAMGDFLADPAVGRVDGLGAPVRRLEPGDEIGGYRVVRLVGAGGAGAVYEAEQRSPHRRVALKVMQGGLASESAVGRFRDEAEILARLQHPDIAHVYEAGVHEGTPWFAMEYVDEARTLVEHAADLDLPARLRLFARVCDAIHHGHQKGVVHRDIKPGNVLVRASGQLKVIDFGIAQREGPDVGRREIVGTVPYMSPEQLEPDDHVDVRTDVYSLGVLLYELLSCRLPHDVAGKSLTEASRAIREEPPAPLERRFRGDLTAIVDKALAKDRDQRYGSATALADEVRRHLEHRPVEAMPPRLLYQLGKFARRHRGAFAAATAILLVSIIGGVVSGWLAIEKEHQREVAATLARDHARERRRAEFQAYVANLAAAYAALRVHDVGEARLRLDSTPQASRGWEWHHLYGRLDRSTRSLAWESGIAVGVLSADGGLLVASSWFEPGKPVAVWNAETRRLLYTLQPDARADALALDRTGRRLALGRSDGVVEIVDARTGGNRRELGAHAAQVTMVDFSPDGALVASSGYDGAVKVWEAGSGRLVHTLTGHAGKVFCVRFGVDGKRLYSGGGDGSIRVWDARGGAEMAVLTGHESNVEDLALSPDGRRLVSGSMDHTVRLWDLASRKAVAEGRSHANGIKAVAFAPDGDTFASASIDRTIRLWDAGDGREIACLVGHTHRVYDLAYEPSGQLLVSFSLDGTLRWWDVAATEAVPALRGHRRSVERVLFADDGQRLLSASPDGACAVWDLAGRRKLAALPLHGSREVALGPRGQRLFVLELDGIHVVSVPGQRILKRLSNPRSSGTRLLRVGRRLFLATSQGEILVRDTETYGEVARLDAVGGRIVRLDADPTGRWLASMTWHGTTVWDLRSLERAGQAVVEKPDYALPIAWSPDGSRFAVANPDGSIQLADWRTNRVQGLLRGHMQFVNALAFSPDGKRLASGGGDGTVRIWDVAAGAQILVLQAHLHATESLAWSPDGAMLVSGGGDWFPEACVVRIWRGEAVE